MKSYLLSVNDAAKAEALAGFLWELNFVEELRLVSHWQDDDFDDEAMEKEVKENMVSRRNPAIVKHLLHED